MKSLHHDTTNFRLDEYEQSAEEFEQYVQSMDSKSTIQRTRHLDLTAAVVDYVAKFRSNDGSDLHQLCGVLKSLRDWGASKNQKDLNQQLYQIQTRMALVAQKHTEFKKQLSKVQEAEIELRDILTQKLKQSQGFTNNEELDQAINQIAIAISQGMQQGRNNDQMINKLDQLKGFRPAVREIEKLQSEMDLLMQEKQSILQFIKDCTEDFNSLKVRENYLETEMENE